MKLQGRALQQVAGAYTLGTVNPRVRRRFETLMTRDLAARRACQQWEERLSGLTREMPPVRPPDNTWPTIEQRIAPKPPRARRSQRWVLIAALVLATAVLIWIGANR